MEAINATKVIDKALTIGKKVSVKNIINVLSKTFNGLERNPNALAIKSEVGEDNYDELLMVFSTMFLLDLLASTHDKKEFAKIYQEILDDTKNETN